MTTETPTIPPQVQSALDDIERLRRNHPGLFRDGVTLFLGESGLSLNWPYHNVTMEEIHALALSYPDAGWKPKNGSAPHELDWCGVIDGVKVRLPRAQSLPLEKLPDKVDLEAIKAKSAVLPAAMPWGNRGGGNYV